ncbi:MAG: DUF1844 domain-containing protein [Actinomycetota bacterium]
MDDRESEHEEEERPRPRVVDKRISARRAAGESPPSGATPPPEPQQPDPQQPEPVARQPQPGESQSDAEEPLWTPDQEAQVRQMAEEMARVPSLEWVVNFAVNLANIAGVKLQSGQLPEAQLAIDALAGLMSKTTGRLADAEAPLRQTLAQLQMSYAQAAAPPTTGPASTQQ